MEQSLCHHGVESQQPSLPVSNYTQPIRTKRKPAQTHSSNNRKKEKKEKWNHLNVKWPMLAHATTLTSSSSSFPSLCFCLVFLHRYRKRVASRQTWWRGMQDVAAVILAWIHSELFDFKGAASLVSHFHCIHLMCWAGNPSQCTFKESVQIRSQLWVDTWIRWRRLIRCPANRHV